MALDPTTTTRLGLHTAREVISGQHITYPVPYLLVILSALCLACLIAAMFAVGAVQTVALALSCAAFLVTMAIIAYALLFRPELLRSERHQQIMRVIDVVADSDMDQTTRTELLRRLPLERPRGRPGTRMGDRHD